MLVTHVGLMASDDPAWTGLVFNRSFEFSRGIVMASYQAPLRDMRFVLNEVFQAGEEWASMPRTSEVTPDLADAILEEGARVTRAELFPLNQSGDAEGCHFKAGKVTTPTGFKAAL